MYTTKKLLDKINTKSFHLTQKSGREKNGKRANKEQIGK